jgi:hypothetical protein
MRNDAVKDDERIPSHIVTPSLRRAVAPSRRRELYALGCLVAAYMDTTKE